MPHNFRKKRSVAPNLCLVWRLFFFFGGGIGNLGLLILKFHKITCCFCLLIYLDVMFFGVWSFVCDVLCSNVAYLFV